MSLRTRGEALLAAIRALQESVFDSDSDKAQKMREMVADMETLRRRLEDKGGGERGEDGGARLMMTLIDELRVARSNDVKVRELASALQQARFDLDAERKEGTRQRERLREATVTATRCQLQLQQMSDDLVTIRAEAAKSERKAIKEARDGVLLKEENVTLKKRVRMLELDAERNAGGGGRSCLAESSSSSFVANTTNKKKSTKKSMGHTKFADAATESSAIMSSPPRPSPPPSNTISSATTTMTTSKAMSKQTKQDKKKHHPMLGLEDLFDEIEDDEDAKQFDYL